MLYLDPDEHVLMEVRKHWFVFVAQGVLHFLAAILPAIVFGGIVRFFPYHIPLPSQTGGVGLFLYSLWLLVVWVSFFVQWTTYYLDVWYVTEKRIIDVDQKRLFDRTVSNLRFDKIQDITVEIEGFISTLLNIGDIKVQTAAEDSGDFFMHRAANPDRVRSFIFSQHNIINEKYMPHKPVSNTDNASNKTF